MGGTFARQRKTPRDITLAQGYTLDGHPERVAYSTVTFTENWSFGVGVTFVSHGRT